MSKVTESFQMTEERARAQLIKLGNSMRLGFMAYSPSSKEVTLDGSFNVSDLAAIAWWIENKPTEDFPFDEAPPPEVPPNPLKDRS